VNNPIFILAISPRSGSTYLSRLLTSTNDVLIWGESTLLTYLYPLNQHSSFWTKDKLEDKNYDLHYFRKHKHEMFSNRLLPLESDLEKHWCQMIDSLFTQSSLKEGYSRWGLKETNWTEKTTNLIKRNWSNPKIIYLYRDFISCYKSVLGSGLYGTHVENIKYFIQDWLRQARFIASIKDSEIECKFDYDSNPLELVKWCNLSESKKIAVINSTTKEITNKRFLEIYEQHKDEIQEVSQQLNCTFSRNPI
jgi:hypothetical protein